MSDTKSDSTLEPRAEDKAAVRPGEDVSDASKQASVDASAGVTSASQALEGQTAAVCGTTAKPRWVRGGVPLVVGGFTEFCLCAADAQFRWGVPVGILATAVAVWGLLDLLGSFDEPSERVASKVSIRTLAPWLGWVLGSLAFTLVVIGLAVAGRLPIFASAILVPAGFLSLVASVFRLGQSLGPWADANQSPEDKRPLLQRHGFWVIVAGTLLYLPLQGSYSLSDPWETHYGEVAREILARNDWISTWWAQDGWFWSKPVLNFWTEGLSMAIFGAGYQPDQMLAGVTRGLNPWPEWAIRMPVFIMTIVALYFMYKGVAKVFGRRAGMLGAFVLATMPHWVFLAHQTMTDMPFVSAMTTSMGLLLLGLHTDPEREVRGYCIEVGGTRYTLTAFHLVFGAILMAALPQILYLVSRNIELQLLATPHGFRPHLDEFFSGSAGNCGLEGNQECARTLPANKDMQPWIQGLLWTGVAGFVLWINRGERRLSRLYFLTAWFFAAVSTMGKGPAGFGLPMLCAGAYIFATAKWKKLFELEFLSGALIILCVALPWYVAMFMRHGQPFTDRLLFHDMWKRALTHVHDTNVGDDVSFRYFIWQLGYAMFPWTGLVPAALVWWARKRDDASGGRGDVMVFLTMWFVFAFALFTAMLTKFHHYIFPAVPPAAMLTGILLDRMLGDRPLAAKGKLATYLITLAAGVSLSIYGVFRFFPGMLFGFKPEDGAPRAPSPIVGALVLGAGLAVIVGALLKLGARGDASARSDESRDSQTTVDALMIGAVGIGAAVTVGLVGRDLAVSPKGETLGQERLLHLFTYNYKRPWPESLDFSGMLAAFGVAAVALMLLLVVYRLRHHAVVLMIGLAFAWAVWAVDIYMVKTAPHWGQRETIMAYYQDRKAPTEPLVAYQMNWKGENFYTSNRIPAFVSSGAKFKAWIAGQRKAGIKTFYFVTEHGRVSSLKGELGEGLSGFDAITDRRLDNKFGVFRAVF